MIYNFYIKKERKMKKIVAVILALTLTVGACALFTACGSSDYTVGICQLMKHDALDQSTKGFIDALTEEMEKAGKKVKIETQIPDDQALCPTVINVFTSKNVDLIMANATPALLAAANATDSIPILGTSVTDYNDTFKSGIPANVSGTSDAVPFAEQAAMMVSTLGLKSGDTVGVLYCSNESNSIIQYNAVKEYFDAQGINVNAYTFAEATELQTVVNSMVGKVKALYIPSDNTVSQNDSIVGEICEANLIPVYTSYGGKICYASLAIDYYELGRQTGLMAAKILLEGQKPSDIKISTLTPTVFYNEELCEKLGITVPEN